MGKRKLVKIEPAYSGKYIDYKGSTYQLVQTETSSKYCEGCAFYNRSVMINLYLTVDKDLYLKKQNSNE